MTRQTVVALGALLCAAIGARGDVAAQEMSPDVAATRLGEETQDECTEKLKRIWTAIDGFRKIHGEFPEWLSDLRHEGLVADSTVLVCPVTLQTGRTPTLNLYFPDPRVPGSYLYEFNPTPFLPGAEPGEMLTMREWKTRQQELVGGRVPLVRCVLHGAVLNIGAEGDFFENDLSWEAAIEDPEVRSKLPPGGDQSASFMKARRRADEKWIGAPAPSVPLELLGGGWVDPADRRGEVVVLEFWATWCAPCARALPYLQQLAEEYAEREVTFLTVNVKEAPDVVQRFLDQRDLELAVALDRDRRAASLYGTHGVPRTVVVGKDCRVAAVHNGSHDYLRVMRRHLEDALD